eukprot:590253-Amphidinium_carterae.1
MAFMLTPMRSEEDLGGDHLASEFSKQRKFIHEQAEGESQHCMYIMCYMTYAHIFARALAIQCSSGFGRTPCERSFLDRRSYQTYQARKSAA